MTVNVDLTVNGLDGKWCRTVKKKRGEMMRNIQTVKSRQKG